MGAAKEDVRLGGKTFLERIRSAAADVFDEVIAVQRARGPLVEGMKTIREQEHERSGAIFGLECALTAAAGAKLWLLATDYPLVTAALLRDLRDRFEASGAAALVPWWGGHPQPLCAGYAGAAMPAVLAAIRSSQLRVRSLVEALDVEHVLEGELRTQHGGEPLLNVNDPETLALARRLDEKAHPSR